MQIKLKYLQPRTKLHTLQSTVDLNGYKQSVLPEESLIHSY